MRFEECPSVESGDVRLRPIELSDIDAWHGYLSMPQASGAHELEPEITPTILGPSSKRTMESDNPASSIRFAILDESTQSFIGSIGFHTISPGNRTAEIVFDLHPAQWGRGIASRCCKAVVDWGIAQRHYVRIQATALDTNAASVRVMEKCGFSLEGKLQSYRKVRGGAAGFLDLF